MPDGQREGAPGSQAPGNQADIGPGNIGPINPGAARGVLISAFSLFVAVLAVLSFAFVAPAIDCAFRPVTYAIFTAIALVGVAVAFGGQALLSGAIDKVGIHWTVTGAAAFLLIAGGAVWWATKGSCSELADLRLTQIPAKYAISDADPSEPVASLRIRFDQNVKLKFVRGSDRSYDSYDLYFAPAPSFSELHINIDLIHGKKAAQVCRIVVRAPDRIVPDLAPQNGYVAVLKHVKEARHVLRLRDGFVEEILKTYPFEKKYPGGDNNCIEVEHLDEAAGKSKFIGVDEIIFRQNTLYRRMLDFAGDPSSLGDTYSLHASRQPTPSPTDATDKKPTEPAVDPVRIANSPTNKEASCVNTGSADEASAALTIVKDTGVLEKAQVKLLFEHWCRVGPDFYRLLASDPTARPHLVRFIRNSITAIDSCWASNDVFRKQNASKLDCKPRLDQPRDFDRLLPWADSQSNKKALLELLRDDNIPVRREVETILRLYPHNDFEVAFNDEMSKINAYTPEIRHAIAQAAIGYYYNRIIEKSLLEDIESAKLLDTDLSRGRNWAAKLSGVDRENALARLDYAKAHVYVQLSRDPRPATIDREIRTSFDVLLRLSPDALSTYPYTHHIARAVAYNRGNSRDVADFGSLNVDRLERQPNSKPRKFDPKEYSEATLRVVPNSRSSNLRKLEQGEEIKSLMKFDPDPRARDDEWAFVLAGGQLGWLKLANKATN